MNNQTGANFFDENGAAAYDERWTVFAPMQQSLYAVIGAILTEFPRDARILCVGAGTGSEIIALAAKYPGRHFTAIEPAPAMLAVCRRRVADNGFADRCTFHEGYLDTLPAGELFDAATCLFVSHFVMPPAERSGFFGEIAARLRPGAMLISADLSADLASAAYESLLRIWTRMTTSAETSAEEIERMRQSHNRDVAVLPSPETAAIIQAGGFEPPVLFFQYLLMHAWCSRRESV